MADRAEVPPSPLVTITVDDDGRVAINGHDVPHRGSVDPRQVATEVVCSDFAQPLGRPVRAIATLPHEQVRMIIHPDGHITDVERHQFATPTGVPPATRARAWLSARDADRIAAEVAAARHAGRHRRHPLFAAGAGAIVAGVALVTVWQQRSGPDPAAVVAPPPPAPAADAAPPAQTVHESVPLRPVAVSGVSAEARAGELRLSIAAQRRTPVRLSVVPVADPAAEQRLDLSIQGQAQRVVTVSDLEAGRYRWVVRVPGQPDHTGVTRVPGAPETEPNTGLDTVPVTYDPPTSPGTSGGSGGAADEGPAGGDGKPSRGSDPGDRPALTGVGTGPNQPVDPDGD